jgi:hypothetical protein
MKKLQLLIYISGMVLMPFIFGGCKKLVDIPAPTTELSTGNVYSSNASAAAVLTGVYVDLSQDDQYCQFGYPGLSTLFLNAGLYSDELTLFDEGNLAYLPYYTNNLKSQINSGIPNDFWSNIYQILYVSNDAIAGLSGNTELTPEVQHQLLGESLFLRAFCYFYLVNLYGPVPLVTTTDYKVNALLPRRSATDIWKQIITDLQSAQALLNENYVEADGQTTTSQRVRPNKWAATALLSRAYLYTEDWKDAALQATSVIQNSTLFAIDSIGQSTPNAPFVMNSTETIWSLQPVQTYPSPNTGEGAIFILPTSGPAIGGSFPVYLSNYVVNAFEPGDLRRALWVDSVSVGGITYYYAYKYQQGDVSTSTAEYDIVFRLAEQYLILAEAEANQGDSTDAITALNIIRERAHLSGYSPLTNGPLLTAILHERQVELFTEWGHRRFDLVRTGNANSVMGAPENVCGVKGGTWSPSYQLFPINYSELATDPNLVQTPGY